MQRLPAFALLAGTGFLGLRQAVAVGGLLFALAAQAADRPDRFGRVLDEIRCEADAAQSYALYVPTNYAKQKKWPVIFCFDPAARGRIPVERLQIAAEKYGFIVAGSLTSRNGPYAANAVAVQALMKDVSAHFSVDAKRVYAAGLSGGARLSIAIALSGVAKGVIACGAGFPVLADGIPQRVPFTIFGTTGTEDFNYGELLRLDRELEERGAVHRVVVFDGTHEWAQAPLLTEAVEWLKLQAMRSGAEAKDTEFIEAMLRTRRAALPTGPASEICKAVKSIASDFRGLADIGEFEKKTLELGATREVKESVKAERALAAREEEWVERLGDGAMRGASRRKSLAEELRQKADAAEDSAERRMVRRVRASYLSMTRETVRDCFESGDYAHAAELLEMGVALRPEQARGWLDLARARALASDKQRALEALQQAVSTGFNDAARIETEPAFEKLRGDAKFQATVANLRAAPSDSVVLMPAMKISTVLASVELRPFYKTNGGGEAPTLAFLRVETVRPNSTAARAGLTEGMELVAIQDRRILGLTEQELSEAMIRPVRYEILLTVRVSSGEREQQIRVALPRADGPR